MTKQKFIDELIENVKTYISIGEVELKTYTDLGDDEEFDRTKNNLDYLKECLNILNQIKYDLEAWGIVQYGIDCKNLGEGRLKIKYGDNDFMGLDKFEIKTIVKSMGGKYENS